MSDEVQVQRTETERETPQEDFRYKQDEILHIDSEYDGPDHNHTTVLVRRNLDDWTAHIEIYCSCRPNEAI